MLEDDVLTSEQLAKILQTKLTSVQRMARDGSIPAFKLAGGNLWRFSRKAVTLWWEVENKWYTVEQAAKHLDLDTAVVVELLEDGDMPGYEFKEVWRIDRQQFTDWLETKFNNGDK